jgi:hypothetical protein
MSNVAIVFPGSQLLAEKLYRQRWWWLMSFGVTLLWNVFYYFLLMLLEYMYGNNSEEFYEVQQFFYYGVAGGYLHFNLFAAIPFLLFSSYLFIQIQKVFTPDTKPHSFLLLRPTRMLELLDKFNRFDNIFKQHKTKQFWNNAFAFSQPVYVLILIFPVYFKLAAGGFVNVWIESIFFLLQFTVSVTWIIMLYRIFSACKLEAATDVITPAQSVEREYATDKELVLVKKHIDKLRTTNLSPVVYQIIGVLAVVFSFSGYLDWNSIPDQMKLAEGAHLLVKIGMYATLGLSLFLLYYLWIIVRITSVPDRPDSQMGWIVVLFYFIPILSTVTRFYAITDSGSRWNTAMRSGRFNPGLRISKTFTVWWAVVFSLFTLYNSGYLREVLVDYLHVDVYSTWRALLFSVFYPFSYLLLHAFLMLLIAWSKELEQKCEAAADELEQSYFPQQSGVNGKHTIDPPHAGATAE